MTETLAQRIRHLEGQLMRWPRSARAKRLLQEARAEEARQAAAEAKILRSRIRRDLGSASIETLRHLAEAMEG